MKTKNQNTMRNIVKTTFVSLSMVVAMSSCTKEEVAEQYPVTDYVPAKKEIPVKEDKNLPLPLPILDNEKFPTQTPPRRESDNQLKELQRENDFEQTPQELKEQENEFRYRPIQKSPDMGIMREMPELQKVVVMVND
ncbi:MAG: hypothetical protein KGV44_00385 [Flavobacteriaceae bacterium]|nr:hypothetical protein [Flavobacteriaceae bacterium]